MSIIEKAVGMIEKSTERRNDRGSSVTAGVSAAQSSEPEASPLPVEAVAAKPKKVKRDDAALGGRGGWRSSESAETGAAYIDIPFDSLQQAGIFTPAVPRSMVAESLRNIKRPLLHNIAATGPAAIEEANLIMVTSALAGEGKTFTAISLAMSIAMEQDKRVLFVDADIAKARGGNLLGIREDQPGLIDVLENPQVSLGDVIMRTNMEKLSILPAGAFHERCNELLASESMLEIMKELSRRYPDRVVIFDSPPVLLTTEAGVLANLMGQIVFVVQADATPQHVVEDALERISADKMVGMVLNKARSARFNRLAYGYGYGYGKGYGYGYSKDGRQRVAQDPGQDEVETAVEQTGA